MQVIIINQFILFIATSYEVHLLIINKNLI